ncbi:MAG TPA: hypothetical protein VN893_08900 [Bryobacteraceae bacterium]|nr:hypothetical protein [Bryobacteraceae bacterium]
MASWKTMPLFPKILIVVLALGVIYRVSNHHDSDHVRYDPAPSPDPGPAPRPEPDASDLLARYQAQYNQVSAQANQCVQELQAYQAQMAAGAMNGAMPGPGPACQQNLPQITVQLALLQTYITRLQTGNPRITVCEANAGLQGCQGLEASSHSSSSYSAPDDGTETVERSTRQGIRGTTLYTDANGEQHELPTRDYYYRDRNTGQFVGSDSPNPPDNGRDYEPLQAER